MRWAVGSQLDIRPISRIARLKPYSPGRTARTIDLFLDANEVSAPPPGLAAALAGCGQRELCRYPSAAGLEARIAARYGVAPEAVLVTAGADDALERAIRAVCEPGRGVRSTVSTTSVSTALLFAAPISSIPIGPATVAAYVIVPVAVGLNWLVAV